MFRQQPMDYEVYCKIKKGKINTLRTLQETELPAAWFVCYCITGEVSSAAELLRQTWQSTIKMIVELGRCPNESFRACLSKELYRAYEKIPKGNEMFLSFPIPTLPQRFDLFVEEIKSADPKERIIYLLNKLGDLGNGEFSELLGIPLHETKEYLYSLEGRIHPRQNGKDFTEYILLSNEFKDINRRLFKQIEMSELFISTLEHDYNSIYNTSGNFAGVQRKDLNKMAGQTKKTQTKQGAGVNRRAAQKKKRAIIISAVAALLVIAIIVTVVIVVQRSNNRETTITTSYSIDEITYGNVSTTISGSGSLTPVTSKALTLAECIEEDADTSTDTGTDTGTDTDSGTAAQSDSNTGNDTGSSIGNEMPSTDSIPTVTGVISNVAVSVGDTVDKGDVIAVITFDDGDDDADNDKTADIVAPYDAVLLEFYLHDGDEVTLSSEVAMFMGTDGYSMTISVDETNISTVKLGQEVDISIDAVTTDDELVGAVTDISYNGSTSGSVTSYGIEVTFDYVTGTYPGMSVSAEIVIEDSGDGLLVPVDAVYTSGDTKYVYLAPSGASIGDEYEEGDLDLSELDKVEVTEGMSDGTYVIIESDKLAKGDLIVITKITSNLTGSDSSNEGGRGDFGGGGFPGGGGGGFPGGEMPEDFDPSQFGGGSFPGFGG